MITFFSTAKSFIGHDAVIQRNALQSWKLLHPEVEVILFGDDEGAAETCSDLGLVHHPQVQCHPSGTKLLDFMFRRAQEVGRHEHFCFANCDIILMDDFWNAFETVRSQRSRFLMVARRWDTDITEAINFSDTEWRRNLHQLALTKGFQRDEFWIDVLLFRKGLYTDMPPLIVGHCFWDNWTIWKALRESVPVIDASSSVTPVHQNHGYNPAFGRSKGVGKDALSQVNFRLVGGWKNVRTISDATETLLPGVLKLNPKHYWRAALRRTQPPRHFLWFRVWHPIWFFFLDMTRPLRTTLGLRSKANKPGHGASPQ